MAWSEAIQSEWNRHQSVFARQWLVSMMKLRKLRAVQEEQSAELREAIEQHSTDPKIVERMLKDTHLFEAALETDLRIVSGDENAHGHFRQLAVTFAPLPPILWVNPVTEGEKAMRWLEEGTPAQRSRRLKR
jgi:hypothetical protein